MPKGIFPATVYLKDPTTDAIMYSTTTDEDGDYEFEGVANGTYYLDGETTIDATYSYDITDAYYIYYNWAGLTGLQALAGDVDGIDGPDITDAYYVYYSWDDGDNDREITGQWTAPIWIFLNPEIDVSSNKTITNAEFGAITSGDAFGDWTP